MNFKFTFQNLFPHKRYSLNIYLFIKKGIIKFFLILANKQNLFNIFIKLKGKQIGRAHV